MPRRNGPRETRSPRAAGVPHRRRAQRREVVPLDEGESDERRRLLQADLLRHREPPVSPDDTRGRCMQPRVPVLLAHPGMGFEFPSGGDDPAFIVDESIRAQRELLTGYGGNPNVTRERFLEAWHPTNVAISLTGEPTLYKRLGEMIDEFKRRKMSTFLVTNGTTPAVLRRMHAEGRLPTQLYVTVAAPNAEIYRKLVAAKSDNEWHKLKETLGLLPTLPTRTVVRHTLVEGWNLGWEDEYAELDRMARPMFIECKGYSFVGESRLRLQAENVPSHASIRTFAEHLADRVGYQIAAEREDSRVVLLTQDGALHPISP